MLFDVVEVWFETLEELGGWRGLGVLFVVMFVFIKVTEYMISRRHVRRAAARLNRERQRKFS